jgi:hypothetical protein
LIDAESIPSGAKKGAETTNFYFHRKKKCKVSKPQPLYMMLPVKTSSVKGRGVEM